MKRRRLLLKFNNSSNGNFKKSNMSFKFIKTILILLSLSFLNGCVTGYYHSGEQKLQMADAFRFPDLPVPEGFKFIPANSFIYESSKVRVGKMKYYGKAWPNSIVQFYKEYMLENDWEILNIIEGEETLLSFNNNKEICIIKFEGSYGKGPLIISISPMFYADPGYSGSASNAKDYRNSRRK
ncbi:MAG: hypothetical protein P9M02_04515 [Candidatus Susulua stagnicola]|nr:hypothetical protein [Candidatus Susulua stagnicola]